MPPLLWLQHGQRSLCQLHMLCFWQRCQLLGVACTTCSGLHALKTSAMTLAAGVLCRFANNIHDLVISLASLTWSHWSHFCVLVLRVFFWCVCVCLRLSVYGCVRVVPDKAEAEVSRIGHKRRGELLWCVDGRANPLMDRKVVGVVLFGVVAVVAATTAGCSVL